MILNYYSVIGMLALMILLIENQDILLSRNESFSAPAWKTYRKFLCTVIVYYLTDIVWGILESYKLQALLFADTTVYFVAMAVGAYFWMKYTVIYLDEGKYAFGRFFLHAGRCFGITVATITVANIFVPILFIVDDGCRYQELFLRYVVLVVQILLLLLISAYAFTSIARRRHLGDRRGRYRALGMFGLIMAAFLFAQLWYPYLPLYAIAFMLGTCLLRANVIRDEREEYRIRLVEADRVTEQRLAEERVREEHTAYARISALSGDYLSIHVVDPETDRYHEYSANAGFKSFELPEEGTDFFNVTRELSRELVYPDDLELFLNAFTKENVLAEIKRDGIFTLTYRLIVREEPVYIRLKCAMTEEAEGRRLIVGINDVDARVRREQEYKQRLEQAEKKATVDALTGIRNKYAYLETEAQLDRRIDEKTQPEFAIVVLDVNDLKNINDRKGHLAGDQYLRDASRTVCETFKHSPVFRVGGDEFVVIVQGHDYQHLDRLIGNIAEHNREASGSGKAVIACGMSKYKDDASVATVFRRADANMYENKKILKAMAAKQS